MGKDAFDGAVCLRLAGSRRMDEVLGFLGECWKDLGLPAQVQFDNARELCRLGAGGAAPVAGDPALPALRRRPGVHPEGEPQFNGSVENFNGWFQAPLFDRSFTPPGGPAAGTGPAAGGGQHAARPPTAGGQDTGAAPPRPAAAEAAESFVVPTGRLTLAAGRVTFIRRVSVAGTVTVLSQCIGWARGIGACTCSWSWTPGAGADGVPERASLKRWPYKAEADRETAEDDFHFAGLMLAESPVSAFQARHSSWF